MPKTLSSTIYNSFVLASALTNYAFGYHMFGERFDQAAEAGPRGYDIPITTIGAPKIGQDHYRGMNTAAGVAGISGGMDMYVFFCVHVPIKVYLLPIANTLQPLHNSHKRRGTEFCSQYRYAH